jgi:hypothetical protein
MPRRKQTLAFGVTSQVPLGISGDDWKNIEKHSGFAIPPDIRGAVAAKTQTMRWRSEAWQSALPTREAIRQIAGAKRTTVGWLKWMDGLSDDARAAIMSVDEWERFDLVIKPFMNFVVASCDKTLPELKSDLTSKEAQDVRPPWEDWIFELTDLFDQCGLPTPARTDVDKTDNQSPFTIFIWELQKLIEKQYRLTIPLRPLPRLSTAPEAREKPERTRQDE